MSQKEYLKILPERVNFTRKIEAWNDIVYWSYCLCYFFTFTYTSPLSDEAPSPTRRKPDLFILTESALHKRNSKINTLNILYQT